jgi:hypothetical protein
MLQWRQLQQGCIYAVHVEERWRWMGRRRDPL